MRRHNNLIVYGILSILSALLIFCVSVLSYPLLSFVELFKLHPVESWIIPILLIIAGFILIKIEKRYRK